MEPTVDYEELERLADKATPGPWVAYKAPINTYVVSEAPETAGWYVMDHTRDHGYVRQDADARFITSCRSAVPVLLSERRKLHRALEIATEALRCLHWYDGLSCDDAEPGPGVPCTACAAREAVRKLMEDG